MCEQQGSVVKQVAANLAREERAVGVVTTPSLLAFRRCQTLLDIDSEVESTRLKVTHRAAVMRATVSTSTPPIGEKQQIFWLVGFICTYTEITSMAIYVKHRQAYVHNHAVMKEHSHYDSMSDRNRA